MNLKIKDIIYSFIQNDKNGIKFSMVLNVEFHKPWDDDDGIRMYKIIHLKCKSIHILPSNIKTEIEAFLHINREVIYI